MNVACPPATARVEISPRIPVLPLWLIPGWRILVSQQNHRLAELGGLVIRPGENIMVGCLAGSPVLT